jgi:membrane-bound ClpP family serine protease
MHSYTQLYIILVASGLFLLGAEIFLPGGIIGVIGALALVAAIVVGFLAFGAQGGLLSGIVIVLLSGVAMILWAKFFPRTGVGRSLTLSQDGKLFKAGPADLKQLVGKEGVALTILRPSGMARIDNQRVDVVADGSYIAEGRTVKVTGGEGLTVPTSPRAARSKSPGLRE